MSKIAKAALAKAAALKAKKQSNGKNGKAVSTKPAKKAVKKNGTSTRVRITDAKGHEVTGRDNSFVCPECKSEITGPWSFKMHLVKQHDYSRKQAGLREEK